MNTRLDEMRHARETLLRVRKTTSVKEVQFSEELDRFIVLFTQQMLKEYEGNAPQKELNSENQQSLIQWNDFTPKLIDSDDHHRVYF